MRPEAPKEAMMPSVDTPLTRETRDAVSSAWGLDAGDGGERLFGGEESAAFRVGAQVVRIGPTWRTTAELEWCHTIALATAQEIPEVVPPLPHHAGATVIRVAGRPVSVWPYIEGSRVDDDDPCQRAQAAELLARLHQVFGSQRGRFGPRPDGGGTVTTRAIQHGDSELHRWVRAFDAEARWTQPIHGDFYAGNLLARSGHIVALLDWDEAILSRPERELAWAAWEFGDGLWADNLDEVSKFVALYKDAGGPADPPDDLTLRSLVRERLLGEMYYVDQNRQGIELNDEDRSYRQRQQERYEHLRS
jgi:Ser/Thr protein kinase RdoA (MazF antagonist)